MAPRQAETGLLGGLGPSKSRFQLVFFCPGGLQERSKRPTGGENKGKIRTPIAKRPPRALQDALGSHFGAIFEPFGCHFGAHVGTILELSVGSVSE